MKVFLIAWSLWLAWGLPPRPLAVGSGVPVPRPGGDIETGNIAPGSTKAAQAPEQARKAVISGAVTDQSGQPLSNAPVYLRSAGSNAGSNRTEWTDDDGKFQFSGLFPGVFIASARVATHYMDSADDQPMYVRPGESIKIRMIKGGIITGKVTSLSGEPLIAAAVRPTRVKDQEGKPATGGAGGREFQTDDRGFYRIYGLLPGSYVVSVGGSRGFNQQKPYDLNAPTYYPSSTRDTASEVLVSAGQETSGIDIRYREEPGYRVSGTVTGIPISSSPMYAGTGVSLANVKTGFVESTTYLQGNDPNRAFIFYGVPDGEYDLAALKTGGREDGLASAPRRISVKGADVTGLDLALAPLGKISGQLILDPIPDGLKKEEIRATDAPPAEILITARRDGKQAPGLPSTVGATPDEKGKFVMGNLSPATYRFEIGLPSEDWYVRGMTSGKTDKAQEKPRGRAAPASIASDIAARGLAIKAGDHLDGLSITIGRGAAYIAGTVTPAADGATLPPLARVCLVPDEPERAGDVLCYMQALVAADGKFVIAHVPPGKYRAVVVAGPVGDSPESRANQIAWEPGPRKQLRQRAESDGVELELAPRKRIKDLALKYKPPAEGARTGF